MSEEQIVTVWVTKYALSKGVYDSTGRISEHGTFRRLSSHPYDFLAKKSYCMTKEEALKVAEKMRVRRIASLQKQIAKLEKLRFE